LIINMKTCSTDTAPWLGHAAQGWDELRRIGLEQNGSFY
jgi:hypothetical protein